ncbi:Sensor histidine kinase RcsC [Caballeronia sp. SBC1]|uniref:ATP-binding protein n=1 Tax=Caballeronia sp. SBC1 TaxID=2705548 RepID=UPI00140EDD99|nr:ATP-binding protein [Caballeronia sp. SBC1]QIN60415.1 Sensor histidine kinase RcsC [Caballeronia sp. SBC1]
MSSPSIRRLIRLMTLLVLVWATSSVSAEPLRVDRAKATTQGYSTLIREEFPARRSESMPASSGPKQSQTLSLSADERAYLHSLPPLTLGVDGSWAPFSYVDSRGESSGIAMAYATYLSKALDIDFEQRVYPDWAGVSNAFARGQIDMLTTTERETPRLAGGISTGSVADYPLVMVGRLGEPVTKGIEEALSWRIVVTARLAASGRLGNLPPSAALIIAPTLSAGLDRVARGEADLFVGDLVAADIALAARYEDELKIIGPAGNFEHMSFALRPEFSRLVPLIDRALSAMPDADKQRILAVRQAALDPPASGWSVNAMRLLPALIAIGVVLAVTLRAFVLLQREMARRVETEQRLATQLSFQQTMMEVVPYPLIAKDRENRYIAVNRAFEKTLGLRREDIIGRTTLEVQSWGPDNSQRLHDLVGMSIAHGRREQVEIDFYNRDGAPRHGLFWTGAFAAANGAMAGVVGTMVDITDIRDAEMRARENERRLHDVTRSLPAVVFQLRRANDGSYSFPYIGGDTRHLFGADLATLSNDQVAGLSLIHADDKHRVLDAIERSALTLEPVHTEFRSVADKGRRWIRADLVAHREADGVVVWNGYWVDASVERARADELAAARDAAEAASRAKDDFLAMMSHEIRTPMNGVLGLVEVFETTPLNPDQSQMLGMIQDSASALLQILDDLLDYSKIEAGRLTIESMPIDLRELVDNAIGLLAGRAHEKGLRVRVDVSPDIAASVRGDSVRLRQVLFNLISNAIKFTMKGEVTLSANLVSDTDGVQTVELIVEDTGIGIAADAQASLFEPFVQAESSTTRRFGGTGLGLTICNRLVELMGGTLELQSQVGVGTRMIVRLDMPIETTNYQIDGLRGKSGIIAIDDQRVARALVDYGQALGLKLTIRSRDDAALRDPHTFDGIDLVFLSETHPEALPLKTRVIHVTEKPKPTGYRILDNDIRVSVNPISWRGLGAACVAALTGLPQLVSRATRDIETNNEPPDRERAIRMGRLVLVAEDHPVNQELIRHQLALLGFACDVVQDGVEALTALKQTRYGFLITDCHMPNMTGYELARRVRASELGLSKRLPILGITASTAPEELSMCREAGMDDCFVKPTRLVTLRDHLNRWRVMDSGSAAPEPVVIEEPNVETLEVETDEVDLDYMTQLWGSETTVKALLDAFVSSFRDDLDTLRALLDGGSVAQLREWHHRVIGAASVLQYRPLQIALDGFRRDLVDKPDGLRRQDGAALITRCEVLLERIEAQCAELA